MTKQICRMCDENPLSDNPCKVVVRGDESNPILICDECEKLLNTIEEKVKEMIDVRKSI